MYNDLFKVYRCDCFCRHALDDAAFKLGQILDARFRAQMGGGGAGFELFVGHERSRSVHTRLFCLHLRRRNGRSASGSPSLSFPSPRGLDRFKNVPSQSHAARGSHDLLLFTAAALPKEGLQAARGRQQAAGGGREEAVG